MGDDNNRYPRIPAPPVIKRCTPTVAVAVILVSEGKVAIAAELVAPDLRVSKAVPGLNIVELDVDKVTTPVLAMANSPGPAKALVPLTLMFRLLKVTAVVVLELVMVCPPAPLKLTEPPLAVN